MTCNCAFKASTKKTPKGVPLGKRKKMLDKLVKEIGPLNVFRRLNALCIIKRSSPMGEILKKDRNYVKNNYFGALMRKRITRKNNKPTIRTKY